MTAQGQRSQRKHLWLAAAIALISIIWVVFIVANKASDDNKKVESGTGILPEAIAPSIHKSIQRGFANITTESAKSRKVVKAVLKYGSGEGEVGMIRIDGQTPIGPESFGAGANGTVLIADRVNKRVLMCSPDGKVQRTIQIQEATLNDVFTDQSGGLYVYDQVRKTLHQYDLSGGLVSELSLDPADIGTRGYFHAVGDSLFFADAASKDVLVGTMKDGVLTRPDSAMERKFEGVHGASGRMYSLEVERNAGLRVKADGIVSDSGGLDFRIPLEGILAARFAGEDGVGKVYVQTERLVENTVKLEVLVFGADGTLTETVVLPENDYSIWTTKLLDVANTGTIIQFLPAEDHASLSLFLE